MSVHILFLHTLSFSTPTHIVFADINMIILFPHRFIALMIIKKTTMLDMTIGPRVSSLAITITYYILLHDVKRLLNLLDAYLAISRVHHWSFRFVTYQIEHHQVCIWRRHWESPSYRMLPYYIATYFELHRLLLYYGRKF